MTEIKKSPIKLADLIKGSEEIKIMSSYIVDKSTGAAVMYNRYFDKAQVEKLIIEFFNDMNHATEKGYDFFVTEDQIIKYTLLLIIKHFSHFKDEIGETFEDKITALAALMTTGLYDLFFDEIFDKDEVANVIDRLNITTEKALVANDELTKIIKEAKDKVEANTKETDTNNNKVDTEKPKTQRKPRKKKEENKDE